MDKDMKHMHEHIEILLKEYELIMNEKNVQEKSIMQCIYVYVSASVVLIGLTFSEKLSGFSQIDIIFIFLSYLTLFIVSYLACMYDWFVNLALYSASIGDKVNEITESKLIIWEKCAVPYFANTYERKGINSGILHSIKRIFLTIARNDCYITAAFIISLIYGYSFYKSFIFLDHYSPFLEYNYIELKLGLYTFIFTNIFLIIIVIHRISSLFSKVFFNKSKIIDYIDQIRNTSQ
jgi:hypothetical protein